MTDLTLLFFELIRVAIGTQVRLSRLPSVDEWDELFVLAKKQSLVGVTFIALQKMRADADGPSTSSVQEDMHTRIGMREMTYLLWMGMAAKIHVRNQIVNEQCLTLQKKVSEAGFVSAILKGQAVGAYYNGLKDYRQPGDIDALLWPLKGDDRQLADVSLCKRRKQIISFGRSLTPNAKAFYHHVDVEVFTDTAVELHYTPSWFFCPWTNRRFQKWVYDNRDELFCEESNMIMPSVEFNLVYILTHIYQHLFQEGVGLRQLMDYYFVLKTLSNSPASTSSVQCLNGENIIHTIESLGMKRFASGVMYIMQQVFGLSDDMLLCAPDTKEGAFLLNEVMQAGNFGKYDERINRDKESSALQLYIRHIKRNLTFLTHYPSEVIWAPFWKLWHMGWIRTL